jgi:hypothetical protein
MGFKIEGNDTIGYRVVDDEAGALTGRKATEQDALKVAGIEKPRGRAAKKAEPAETVETPSDES